MRPAFLRPLTVARVMVAIAIAAAIPLAAAHAALAAPVASSPLAQPLIPTSGEQKAVPMTDAQLRSADTVGYREVVSERASLERALLAKAHSELERRGLPYGRKLTSSQIAAAASALGAVSPYAYLKFTLVPSSGDWSYNGYRGNLYFTYGIYNPTVDAYKWYTVSWPAISGNNHPHDQDVPNVGPIPEYTWDFGFLGTTWQGYVSDGSVEFYPGLWRLSPWTSAPYGRCYFETHGGTGTHYFKPTHGCIRLTPSNISSLKTYYDAKMANKKDRSTAHLTVSY